MTPPASMLFIDADPDASFGYAELLRIDGWSVTVAYNAAAALWVARRLRHAIAVVHLWSPDPSGFEAAQAVRLAAPACLIVGLTDPTGEAGARNAGCDGVILKPVEAPAFVHALHRVHAALRGPSPAGTGRLHVPPMSDGLEEARDVVRLLRGAPHAVGVLESAPGDAKAGSDAEICGPPSRGGALPVRGPAHLAAAGAPGRSPRA